MSTTDINIINVNGLDYPIKDQKARDVAESAVQIFAYYEDGLVASQAYSVIGTPICWKGDLYYTTTTVAKGNVWQVGVNLRVGDKAGIVVNRINAIESELTANGNRIYMDYKNGQYGYNTSANRGADTFHPFSSYKGTQVYNYTDFGDDGTKTLSYKTTAAGYYLVQCSVNSSAGTHTINSVSGFARTDMTVNYSTFDGGGRILIGYANSGATLACSLTSTGNNRSRQMAVFKFNS